MRQRSGAGQLADKIRRDSGTARGQNVHTRAGRKIIMHRNVTAIFRCQPKINPVAGKLRDKRLYFITQPEISLFRCLIISKGSAAEVR